MVYKTAHRRRRVRSSKRRNAKSRKVMRGGAFTNLSQCKAYVINSKNDYNKRTEIERFINYGDYANLVLNKANPCDSQVFMKNFTPTTA